MTIKTAIQVLCALFVMLAYAASAKAIPTDKNFKANCTFWGKPATCESSWSKGNHESHHIQQYQISDAATGAAIFAGRGLYRLNEKGEVDGYWEDSQGSIHPLTGTWDGHTLAVKWGSAEAEIGKSSYVFDGNAMTSTDWVFTKGKNWRQFMTVSYPD